MQQETNEDPMELLLYEVSKLRGDLDKSRKELARELHKEIDLLKQSVDANRVDLQKVMKVNDHAVRILQKYGQLKESVISVDATRAENCLREFKQLSIPAPDLAEVHSVINRMNNLSDRLSIPKWMVKTLIVLFLTTIFLLLSNIRQRKKTELAQRNHNNLIEFVYSSKKTENEFYKFYGKIDTVGGYRPVIIIHDYVDRKYPWDKGWF